MRRKKMIVKPRYLKTLGTWLAIFWLITAIAFGGVYFLTNSKCRRAYDAEYLQAEIDINAKARELLSLHQKFVEYRKEIGSYAEMYRLEYPDYSAYRGYDAFELETNQALSELYKMMYEYSYRFNTDFMCETSSTGMVQFPLYHEDIGAMASYTDDDGETCLLRSYQPVNTYEYKSDDGIIGFPVSGSVGPAGGEVDATAVDQVNKDLGLEIWKFNDLHSDDAEDDRITIKLLSFYEFTADKTFIPMSFEYNGKVYENSFSPSFGDECEYRSNKNGFDCTMEVFRRPEGVLNSEYTKVYTARTLPEVLTISLGITPGDFKGFVSMMPLVVIKNALLWFAVSTVLAVVVAYIVYLRERSTYEIFEYRKKVTDSMAHDLKTPLAAMSAYAENLEENINTEKRAYYSARIRENIDFMNKTVEGILDFSRSEIGKDSIAVKEVDIRDIFEQEYKETEELFRRKDIKVIITGDLKIKSDEELLKQAIRNLIGNAEKYARSGSTVEVKIDKSKMAISNLTDVKIKDIKDLKKPFVKGEQSRGSESGTGLGLSIADNCLLSAGHRLELEFEGETFKAIVIW